MMNSILVWMCMLGVPATLAAQDDIEGGVTEAGSVEMGMDSSGARSGTTASTRARGSSSASSGGSAGGARIGLQARLDSINTLDAADEPVNGVSLAGRRLFVPIVTPGVRFLDQKLFLGLGLGFEGVSVEQANGDSDSRSGFSLSPLVGYDVLADESAALSLLGWLNLASLGEEESCDPDCTRDNDDAIGLGLNLAAGVRGKLSPGLALGGEFGWGFLNVAVDSGPDIFLHGLFGTIFIEATVGI